MTGKSSGDGFLLRGMVRYAEFSRWLWQDFTPINFGNLVLRSFNLIGIYQCDCGAWITRDWDDLRHGFSTWWMDGNPHPFYRYSCENGCPKICYPDNLRKKIHVKEYEWSQRNGSMLCTVSPEVMDYSKNSRKVIEV